MKKILGIGSVMVDIVGTVDRLPVSGQGVVMNDFQSQIGGCICNSLRIARQMGAESTLFAPIGHGPYASFIREELAACGLVGFDVNTTFDNGAAVCMIEPGGERTMLTLPGIERQFCAEWFENFDASDYVLADVCGYEIEGSGGDAILDFLEEHPEIQTVFAPGPVIMRISEEKMARINALHAVWHLNEEEACAYTGALTVTEAARVLREAGAACVIITQGPHGAWCFDEAGETFAAARSVDVVDTIGAGDAHLGALMAQVVTGVSWGDALARANEVAAAVCCVSGATLPVGVI